MPRKCSTNGQEEDTNIKKESDDHANVPQKGNPGPSTTTSYLSSLRDDIVGYTLVK